MRVRPLTEGPSKAEVDGLIAVPKLLLRLPLPRLKNGCLRMRTDRIYWSNGQQTGLLVDAHVPAKTPRRGTTPQVALVWRNENVRCIDWKLRRPFADGTVVEGWHEHLWDEQNGRELGVPFPAPVYGSDDLEVMFVVACQHWGIHIRGRDDQVLRLRGDE